MKSLLRTQLEAYKEFRSQAREQISAICNTLIQILMQTKRRIVFADPIIAEIFDPDTDCPTLVHVKSLKLIDNDILAFDDENGKEHLFDSIDGDDTKITIIDSFADIFEPVFS